MNSVVSSGTNGDPTGENRYDCPCCRLGKLERGELGLRDKEIKWLHRGFLQISELTDRELQMFDEMACGPTNEQLSNDLGITIRTVKFHLDNIRLKLGGISRLQMCLLAMHHRIATCPVGHVPGGAGTDGQ